MTWSVPTRSVFEHTRHLSRRALPLEPDSAIIVMEIHTPLTRHHLGKKYFETPVLGPLGSRFCWDLFWSNSYNLWFVIIRFNSREGSAINPKPKTTTTTSFKILRFYCDLMIQKQPKYTTCRNRIYKQPRKWSTRILCIYLGKEGKADKFNYPLEPYSLQRC